jgi:hypothetical protein
VIISVHFILANDQICAIVWLLKRSKQMTNEALSNEWIAASRAQRAAYFAWQNASGDQVATALAAYQEANRVQKEIEKRAGVK